MQKACIICNKVFNGKPERKYCSKECSNVSRQKRNKLNCSTCNKIIFRTDAQLEKSKHGFFFCSRECKEKAQSLKGHIVEIRPNHYGKADIADYRLIAAKNFPRICRKCKYKEFPEILEVHHKDRNRKNNSVDNLEYLCPNCHALEHFINKTGKWAQ